MVGSLYKRHWALAAAALLCMPLSGCAVVAVTSAAISVTASVVELTADAAVGTARIVGKGVGKAADALLDDAEAPAPAVAAVPVASVARIAPPASGLTGHLDPLPCGSTATQADYLSSDSHRQMCD